MNIIGIYRRPGKEGSKIEWKKLFRGIKKNEGILVMGDFNAHHRAWNCWNTDKIGKRLLEEMENEDMYVLNNDTESRQGERNQRNSNLNLIFVSGNVIDKIEYLQGKDTWGSDHYPIIFSLSYGVDIYKRTNRISTKKTDWIDWICQNNAG